ncbi:hypothetical protein ACFQAT_22300 [Undibacterium arcticum]
MSELVFHLVNSPESSHMLSLPSNAQIEAEVSSLRAHLAERDGQIADINQAVVEREGQIASLNQAVAGRDDQIAALHSSIAALHSSNSWRITKPLRFVSRLFNGKGKK